MVWGMHWGWWIFWIVVIIALVWLLSQQRRSGEPAHRPARESPLELLQRRYAAGEISTEEYEERRARLERDRLT